MYISYSLWGTNKVYTYGMIENVLDAKKYYDGWTVRVHYNDTVPTEIIKWLSDQDNVELIHHQGSKMKASNMFWRFEDFFMEDTTVLIRDADSRITEREVGFVNQWLSSSKDFHIIRDNKDHTVPILGGTSGCRNNCLKYIGILNGNRNVNAPPMNFIKGVDLMNNFRYNSPDGYNVDQMFLFQFVYPYIVGNSMIHCVYDREPFAIKTDVLETGFIGEIIYDCKRASEIMGDTTTSFKREGAY